MISLEGSIRTCKVDTGWANRLESDRFLNSNTMICPTWNGVDTSGRPANADSYYTKSAGCNSAADRVIVENGLRPQYIEYINLDAAGIRGGQQCPQYGVNPDTVCHSTEMGKVPGLTGQYGLVTGFSQNIYPGCLSCSTQPDQRAGFNQGARNRQWETQYGNAHQNMRNAGMY
jgi:hypothetical protein